MTIEEKREAIKKRCEDYGETCEWCPLKGRQNCYISVTDEEIQDNYNVMFGDNDPVNHPTHYTQGGIECIDAIRASMTADEYDGFLKGQVIKYVWRYKHKGKPAEDLKKAMFYLDRLIKQAEGVPESADK